MRPEDWRSDIKVRFFLQCFQRDGSFLFSIGTFGKEEGQFNLPTDVSLGRDGSLIVADEFNHRVQVCLNGILFVREFCLQQPHYKGMYDDFNHRVKGRLTGTLSARQLCPDGSHTVQRDLKDGLD